MKAIASDYDAQTQRYSFRPVEVAPSALRPRDVRVQVRAVAANPVDFKVAKGRAGSAEPVIVGWDFAGVVVERGAEATAFQVGDEVYGAGDISRPGAFVEQLAVDERIIAQKPSRLSFTEAAALPLTSLTAWEALLAHADMKLDAPSTVLIIGGAGGVGSAAIQLLKAKSQARVVATASRPDTIAWVRELGADHVVDHHGDVPAQLAALGIREIDAVLSTTHTERHLSAINAVLRPFGHLTLIDDPATLDIVPLKRKALSVHWELMFTKVLYGYALESQGQILAEVARLVDAGSLRSTVRTRLVGMTPENLAQAERTITQGQAIGKVVLESAW